MQNVRVIRPNDRLDEGTLKAVRHMLREVIVHREHIAAAFRQDFRNIYHGTALGIVWSLLLPLVPVLLFAGLSFHRVLPSFEDVNPAAYVALGATVWFLLSGCVLQPLQAIRSRNAEVMKTALPLSAVVVSSFAQILFDTLVRSALVAFILILSSTTLTWTALLAPLALMPAVMMFFGLGLMVGVANVIYADVGRIVNIVVQYGIFISGVIFPITNLPFSGIFVWNPAYVMIEEVRILFFRGLPDSGWLIGAYALAGLVVFSLGCRVFYLMEYRVRGIA